MKFILATLVFVGSVSAHAGVMCIWKDSIRNIASAGYGKMLVVAGQKTYEFEILGSCDGDDHIYGLRTHGSGSRVCVGDEVLVLDRMSLMELDSCPIRSIQQLN